MTNNNNQDQQKQQQEFASVKVQKANFVVQGETIYVRDMSLAKFAAEIGDMFRNMFADCAGVQYDRFVMPGNKQFSTISVLFTPNTGRNNNDGRITALVGKNINSNSRFERYRARERSHINNIQYTVSDEAKAVLSKYIYDIYPLKRFDRKANKNTVNWNASISFFEPVNTIDFRTNNPTVNFTVVPSPLIQEKIIYKQGAFGIRPNINTIYERVTGIDPKKILKEYYYIDGVDDKDIEFTIEDIPPKKPGDEYVLHISATSVNTISKTLNMVNKQIITTQKIY